MSRQNIPYQWRCVPSKAEFLLTEKQNQMVIQANRITVTNGDVVQYYCNSFYKRKQIIDEEEITKDVFKYLLENHKISKYKCIVVINQFDVYIGFRLSASTGIPTEQVTNKNGYYAVTVDVPTREWCLEFDKTIRDIIKNGILNEEEKHERKKEQIRICSLKWHREHLNNYRTDEEYIQLRDYHRKQAREWAANNKERVREYHKKRREAEKAKKALENEDYNEYLAFQDEYYDEESLCDAF